MEREEPEIDADAIALCCTHTHDGPRGSFSGEDHGATSGLRCALRYLPEGYTFVDSEAEMGGYLDQDEAAEQVAEAAAAVILFILTENLAGKMILTDKWTILTAVFTVIAIVLGILTRNKAPKNDDENNEQA